MANDSIKNLIPMMRRIMPEIIASNIVGVQPMSSLAGMVYSMKGMFSDYFNTSIEEYDESGFNYVIRTNKDILPWCVETFGEDESRWQYVDSAVYLFRDEKDFNWTILQWQY